jgi:hypothetical protein
MTVFRGDEMMNARMISFLGMWMVVSTFLMFTALGSAWNGHVVGLLAILFGAWWHGQRAWPKALTMIAGAWLFAASSFTRLQADAIADANGVVIGVLLIVAGLAAAKYADKVRVLPPSTLR